MENIQFIDCWKCHWINKIYLYFYDFLLFWNIIMEKITFHIADYVVFGLMLLVSSGIGIFYACAGGKQKSTNEFLMADRSMKSLPVALSVLASFFSASTLLGTPAEIYEYGVQYWISVFGAILAPISGALLFGPMFFKLKLVSVFEASLGIQFY